MCVCKYVCMNVLLCIMYICVYYIYVCIYDKYVCMYVRMYVSMYVLLCIMYVCVCICVLCIICMYVCMYVHICVCGHSHILSTTVSGIFSHIFVSAYSTVALLLPTSYNVAERPVSSGLTPVRKYSIRDASCATSCHFTPLYTKGVTTCMQ